MASVALCPTFGVGYTSLLANGSPNALGQIWTYEAGTSTPATTYQDAGGTTPLANPIILDGTGRVTGGEIWIQQAMAYKFIVEDVNGNQIGATYDNIVASALVEGSASQTFQAATPAQFDNSNDVSTTAFLKRAGIQLNGQIVLSNSTSLTIGQSGNSITAQRGNAGPITITLPLANAAPAYSAVFVIWNDSTYNVTVAPESGDNLVLGNAVLSPGQSMAVVNDGGTNWNKLWNEADVYQNVSPVYANTSGASPWNAYTVSASLTAPKDGWVVAVAKWIGTGGPTFPLVSLSINGTSLSADRANSYEQTEFGYLAVSAGEVATASFSIGTQGAANDASLMIWFIPATD